MAEEGEDADDQQERGANVLPAKAPENTRAMTQHLLDVIGEVVNAIEPKYAR